MAIDKKIKKMIIQDWQAAFPNLTLFAQDKLYKIVDPVIIGLELIKLPRTEEYRPHFVMYPLWKEDVSAIFEFPIILKEYYNKKGFQYSIPYEKHSALFNEVIETIIGQSFLSFDGSISFREMMSAIDRYSEMRPLSAAPNSYLQAVLQEAKLKIALFVGTIEAHKILEEINRRNWDTNHFKACGVDVSKWLQGLEKIISERGAFLKQLEINKHEKKISNLKCSELVV